RRQLRVACGEDAMPDPVWPEVLDHLAELCDAVLAALLADVDRHAEARLARRLHVLDDLAVVVALAAGPRAGDVDPDDAAWRVTDRLVDDDRVLLGRERPVHHQDQAGAHLRVLEARPVEATDGGHD